MTLNITSVSGEHVYVESGVPVLISGQHVFVSGQPVTISGDHVFIESGAYVVADIAESGMGVQIQSGAHVQISGQHVFVESGVYVVADISESGMGVWISGQHVYVEPGAISGQPVTVSGNIVQISGQHVFVESGVYLASGLHVGISGQHIYQESGAHVVISGQPVVMSGEAVHIGCTDIVRVASLVGAWGSASGQSADLGSGGNSLCDATVHCSGPTHSVIVKSLAGNDDIFVGVSGCLPYSGYGFLLAASEAITLDVCNPCIVYVWAATSGNQVTWIGTDYGE